MPATHDKKAQKKKDKKRHANTESSNGITNKLTTNIEKRDKLKKGTNRHPKYK